MSVRSMGSSVLLFAAETCCFEHGEEVRGQAEASAVTSVMSGLELWRYASGRWVLKICDGDDMVTGHQK